MLSAVEHHQVARGTGRTVEKVGGGLLRYGLVLLMLLSSRLTKFTPTEAQFIQSLVAHTPFLAWLYGLTDVQGASNLIGGVCGAVQLLITVSFLFTTPNPSPEVLGFLSKDVLLFGIAVWLTGDSLRAVEPGEHRSCRTVDRFRWVGWGG